MRLLPLASTRKIARVTSAALAALIALGSAGSAGRAQQADKQLDRIKGVVGFTVTADAPMHQVVGHEELPDDYFAVTRRKSAAELVLGDSSIVSFGENTRVQVGAFTQTASGPGSTITVESGTLRFDIHRPAGGTANYHFSTSTTQIAVRGTVGLLSFINGNTTIACLACAADSVTVTVGTQTIALVTGQVLAVSAAGAIVTGTLSSTILSTFAGAQVSTVAASGPAAATAGVAGGVAGGTVAAAAAAAAAVGVTTAIIVSKPSPTPSTPGTATISNSIRSPIAVPQPAVTPAPRTPDEATRSVHR